jgi:hypothetical protein
VINKNDTKKLNDSVTSSDIINKRYSKNLNDSILTSDAIVSNTQIVTNGLVGYWNSLKGVNGSTWLNIAPNNSESNGVISGATISTLNNSTGMYLASGTTNHIDIPVPTALQSVTSATLEFRVNTDSTSGNIVISSDTKKLLYVYNNGIPLTGIFDTTYTDWRYNPPGTPFTNNVDNYITITADTSTGTITIYVNGVQKGSYTTTIGTISNDNVFRLGNWGSNTMAKSAIIDNIRMYNRVLTQAEITQNYNNGNAIGLPSEAYTKSLSDSVIISDNIANNYSIKLNDSISCSDAIVSNMPIVTNGLLGYWNSKQGVSGTTWQNIAPNATGSNGTIHGTTVTTFSGSNGMYFNGTASNYVDIPVPTALQSVTSATIEFRVNNNSNDSASQGYFLSSDNEPLLWAYQNGVALTGIFDTHYTDWIYKTPSGFTDNVDNYITITADTVTGYITVFVNAVQKGQYKPTSIGKLSNDTVFRLGSTTSPPTAIIDNVRMYNRVLTQSEIIQNYNNGTMVALPPAKNLSDSVSATDNKSIQVTKKLNDSISTSDIASIKTNNVRINLSDSIIINETQNNSTALTFVDNSSISILKYTTYRVNLQETMFLYDENSDNNTALTFVDNNVYGITQSVSSIKKYVSESVVISDIASKAYTKAISLNDSITTSDSKSKLAGRKLLPEIIYSFDVSNKIPNKVLTDSISLTEKANKKNNKVVNENITLTESINKSIKGKTLFDSILSNDFIKRNTSIQKIDSISINDVSRNNTSKKLLETFNIADSSSVLANKVLNETLNLSDSKNIMLTKELNDKVSIDSTFLTNGTRYFLKFLNDYVKTAEKIVKNRNTMLNDSILANEIVAGKKIKIHKNDSIYGLDSTQKNIKKIRREFIKSSELINKSLSKDIVNSIILSDTEKKLYSKSFIDSIILNDTLSKVYHRNVRLSETIGINEPIRDGYYKKSAKDGIYIMDSKIKKYFLSRILNDIISQSDSIKAKKTKLLHDTILVNDTFSKIVRRKIKLSEKLIISEPFKKEYSNKHLYDTIDLLDKNIEKEVMEYFNDDILLMDETFNKKEIILAEQIFVDDDFYKYVIRKKLEYLGISDSISKSKSLHFNLYDSIISDDNIEKFEIHEYKEIYDFILNFVMEQSFDINFAKYKDFDIKF